MKTILTGFILLLVATACGDAAQPDAESFRPQRSEWRTNLNKTAIDLTEIDEVLEKDAIIAIDVPDLVPVSSVDFLEDTEPVLAVTVSQETHAYPIRLLLKHELVNDEIGGVPVLVSFCPLCNSAVVFDRRVDGRTLEFGVSGLLRNSDLIMFDRATETWWQQITGEAIVGDLSGSALHFLPSAIVSWGDLRQTLADASVASFDTGLPINYQRSSYSHTDDLDSPARYFNGEVDSRLPAKERVLALEIDGDAVAYAYSILAEKRVVMDAVGGESVVVFFKPGTLSTMDPVGKFSHDTGAAVAFSAALDGRPLTFEFKSGAFRDRETGSTWNIFGQAVAGPLVHSNLESTVHGNHFWFAWAAFQPETRIWSPQE